MKIRRLLTIGLAVVLTVVAANETLIARGRGGGGRGGGGRSFGGGGISRPSGGGFSGGGRSVSRPSYSGGSRNISRPSQSTNRSPSFSRPSQPIRNQPISSGSRNISRPSVGSSRPATVGTSRPSIGSRTPGSVQFPRAGTSQIGGRQIGSGRVGDRQIGSTDRTPANRVGDRQIGGTDRTPRVGDGQVGRTDRTGRDLGRAAIPGLAASGQLGSRLSGDLQNQLSARRTQFQNGDGNLRASAQGRFENREQMVSSRRDDLQSRMQDRQGIIDDRQANRDVTREDRQSYRDNAREDWQDWAGNDHWDDDWDHDHWHDNFEDHWDHMWDEHPVYSALAVTSWGVNRAGYLFGWGNYYNPYPVPAYTTGGTVVDYSQPLVSDTPMDEYIPMDSGSTPNEPGVAVTGDPAVVVSDPAATATQGQTTAAAPVPGVPAEAATSFDAAREQFRGGKYEDSLASVDKAISLLPKDAALHEFRSLSLFALGRYRESAAAIHAVLAVGPGWNWTTISGLYPNVSDYTNQLRALEKNVRENSRATDARFLLAYHYITCGHNDPAKKQLTAVVSAEPKDTVAADLLRMMGGKVPSASASQSPAAAAGPKTTEAELIGSWKASQPDGSAFELTLAKSGEFTWAYGNGDKKKTIKGVFAVDDGQLAMQPDSGGVMVADVTKPKNNRFDLHQVTSSAEKLTFVKQ